MAGSLKVSDARAQFAAVIERARTHHEPVYVTRRGRRITAVIDADDLDTLLALAEDMADIRAAEQAPPRWNPPAKRRFPGTRSRPNSA